MSTIIIPEPQHQPSQQLQQSHGSNNKQEQLEQVNPIILLKQPEIFKETFSKIMKIAHSSFKNKDLQKGLILYNKAIDMLDLGKNILKQQTSKYSKLTIFVNLAYGYQNLRKLQKASRFCERAKDELDKLISLAKNQEYSIEKYLKLTKFLVTLKFQHCAIVSQLQQHQKALQMCKSTLPQLKEELQTMLKYLRQTSSSKILQKKSGQTVQFSKHVQRFAQNLLVELTNFLNEPLKKFHFYHWEKNPQLNQQQVKKKFIPSSIQAKNQCKRSILGVSKATSWMDEFNIGSIMHMSMVSVDDFETSLPMEEYFFKDKLYELVILCSLSYFTMATQIRFLQPIKEKEGSSKDLQPNEENQSETQSNLTQGIKQGQQESQNKGLFESKSQRAQVILKKYGYEERSQMHKLSQLYHLRSIQIISRHIQAVIPYLMHIIKSYDKHYLKKRELQPIAAINEESQMSMINESLQEYIPEQQIYNDYMKKDMSKNNQPMGELLLQSHDGRSALFSNKKSDQKSTPHKSHDGDISDVKNALDFNPSNQNLINQPQTPSILNENKNNFKKNLSKIVQDPRLQSQIYLYSRAQDQQTSTPQQNQFISGQYLKSKKQIQNVKSVKKLKSPQTKRTKSKSKLNLIKSRQKSKSSTFKKNQKSSQKNIYTYRSPKQEKKSVSRSHYQTSKVGTFHNENQLQIKKYHSPQLQTINESKKRLKTNLSDKSRQKILKKFAGIPNSHYQQKNHDTKGSKKVKQSDKKTKDQDQAKKKQSRYFTTFDGQKQYRIKHQSTTHIKVLYKKKNPQESKVGMES